MKTTLITTILVMVAMIGYSQPKVDTPKKVKPVFYETIMTEEQMQTQFQINNLLRTAIPYLPVTTMTSDQKVQAIISIDANIAFLNAHMVKLDSTNTKPLLPNLPAVKPSKKAHEKVKR